MMGFAPTMSSFGILEMSRKVRLWCYFARIGSSDHLLPTCSSMMKLRKATLELVSRLLLW